MLPYYYPKTTFGVTVALLDVFNDMTINRFDTSGNTVKTIAVPIKFGPTEKAYQFRKEQESGTQYYLKTPSISIVMNGITFAQDRAASLQEIRSWLDNYVNISGVGNNTLFNDFQPTPWDFHFTMYIRTDYMEDFAQIIENILPYFSPKSFLRVKEFSFLNAERNLPVLMAGVATDFTDDMDETQRREINGSIDLVVQGYLYKPVAVDKIVKTIKSQYFSNEAFIVQYSTSGFNATSAIPVSGWQTSGFNVDTDVYWVSGVTSASNIL